MDHGNGRFEKILFEKIPVSVFFAAKTKSTNADAKALLRSGEEAPFIVLTGKQSAGYGQRGSVWESGAEGNLCASLAMRVANGLEKKLQLCPGHVAMAICEALRKNFSVKAYVKWPNDILVGPKKLGGLLLEAIWGEGAVKSAVLGVGMNILWKPQLANSRYLATCLREIVGKDLAGEDAMICVLEALEVAAHGLEHVAREDICEKWKLFDLDVGSVVTVELSHGFVRGEHCGIDVDGNLIIRTARGGPVRVCRGEAKIIDRRGV